jgi:aryl-alcohol dehydrogenase-like predicted oxidoreductase
LNSKIALGTVQLGLSYGINNQTGKPTVEDAEQILRVANEHHIHILDSAEAYGDSLSIIGRYIKENSGVSFDVISKFTDDGRTLKQKVDSTLELLGQERLYAYMYHRFSDYVGGKFRDQLARLNEAGKIDRIGLSLYSLGELETVLRDETITIIQVPLNPFDSSLEKRRLLTEAKRRGKEIHVRSAFLQGLFFKDPEGLTGNLKDFIPSLRAFRSVREKYSLNPRQACFNYVLHQPFVDYAVIGVETVEQLTQNLEAVQPVFPEHVMRSLESSFQADSALLNPSNWKP